MNSSKHIRQPNRGGKVGHDAAGHITHDEVSAMLCIMNICIYDIIYNGMEETVMKMLLCNQ